MRRGLLLAATAFASVVLVLSASAAHTVAPWVITSKGASFSGVFTNTTASVINGVSIGTAEKTDNPITSWNFEGQPCSLYPGYGSAYCYEKIDVEPGKTATFTGTTQKPVSTAGYVACSSADGGMDNTCTDVGAPSTPKVDAAAAKALLAELEKGIAAERGMIRSLNAGKSGNVVIVVESWNIFFAKLLDQAAKVGSEVVIADVVRARKDNAGIAGALQGPKSTRLKDARALLEDAISHLQDGLKVVGGLTK